MARSLKSSRCMLLGVILNENAGKASKIYKMKVAAFMETYLKNILYD